MSQEREAGTPEASRPRIRLVLSAQAERYVRRDAPIDVRRMAAGGALPLPPTELATALFALMHDPDSEVKERAKQSLENLPESVRRTVVRSEVHPAVLSYLARVHREDPELMEELALNNHADDATVAFLATLPIRRVIDIVANNQERLLRCPEIVDALGANNLTGRAQIDRILSFLGLDRPAAETLEPDEDCAWPDPDEISDEAAQAALRAVLGNDASGLAPAQLREDGEELSEEE